METSQIYILAARDVNTRRYPTKEDMYTPGMLSILNQEKFSKLRSLSSDKRNLEEEKLNKINEILSKESVFKKHLTTQQNEQKTLNDKIKTISSEIEILKEDIKNEEQRLLNRGISLPKRQSSIMNKTTLDDQNKNRPALIKKEFWKEMLKWLYEFVAFIVIEAFITLTLWRSLVENKSYLLISLRIAASAVMIVLYHLAEKKYKKENIKIFNYYGSLNILMLLILIFTSPVVNYFFPELISDHTSVSVNFDINATSIAEKSVSKKTILGFFANNEHFLGVISIFLYMLLSFLTRPKENSTIENLDISNEKKHDATERLKHLYMELDKKKIDLDNLNSRLENFKETPSKLLIDILENFKQKKQEIIEIDVKIHNIENKMEELLKNLNLLLEQYKTDFIDIFKDEPESIFTKLKWPDINDLKKYYNIV